MVKEACSPGGSIPTVKLLNKLKSTNYGQRVIKQADREGYIKRIRSVKPEGSGNYPVVNKLPPKGRALLRTLSKVD
jgi:hypothetical protein